VSAYNELQLSSYVDQIFKRVQALEDQIALLSEKAGVPYERAADKVPAEVLELARNGDRLGAIKKYRELTGAGSDLAREVVEEL
jgi:ribosomal protein L7/L12